MTRHVLAIAAITLFSTAHAEITLGVLTFTSSNVTYDYSIEKETGDPNWTTAKVEHLGGRGGNQQHGFHTAFQQIGSFPISHVSPPSYVLAEGTFEYCSTVTPNSELTGSGVPTQVIFDTECMDFCYEPCEGPCP